MFFLVASMRASIYGRLGPGFQVPRLWAMMRHDMKGLLRVLGLSIVLAIVPAVVTGIVGSLLVGGVIGVGAYGLFSNGTAPDMMLRRRCGHVLSRRLPCLGCGGFGGIGVRGGDAGACRGILDKAIRRSGMARSG